MKVCSVCRRCYEDSALSCSEDNHDILSDARAGSLEVIPNYRLEALIESDAVSETFRAVNTILNKPYRIKIIAPESFDDAQKKRFLAETQALSTIIHPNVARVFESGTLPDGSLYAVAEYFTAQTLRECFDNVGKPSEVTALTILRQAAEGLEVLHAANVFHRSIKPENIILTSDAENQFLIKLQNMDFGALRQRQVNLNGDLYLADLRYFSPEQCTAEEADAQTDIYALGVVLYEALAGKVPFDAAYADALVVKQTRENPPEVKINSFDIRMLLTHTLTDALQKTTRARLKSANAMARRLRHIEQLATHSSTPPPAMAYPAAMNKTAVAFTPPAKTEKPVEIETPAETVPAIELPAESAPVIEAAATVENIDFAALPTIAADAASFETAANIEDLPVTAPAINIEETPAAAPAVNIEDSSLTEFQTVAETQPAIEIPAVMETRAAIEIPAETLPAIELRAVAEDTPVVETEPELEESPAIEALASFETAPSIESAATENAVEEAAIVESFAPVEDSVSAESAAPRELNAVAGENEAVAESAAETQNPAPEETPAEEVVRDYSTNKLPPIERILADPNFKITEVETVFSLKRGNLDIHKSNEPVLIDWEQPDDVPTTTAALNISKKKFADTQFVTNADVIEEKNVEESADSDEVEYVSEAHKTRRDYESVSSVFATYEDSGRSWNLPGKRAVLTGAAICGLIVIAVGGVFLNRRMQSVDAETTAAKASPTAKTLPKTVEPQRNAETVVPAKPENLTATSVENADAPEVPNYEPRETTDVKTVAPALPNNSKKRSAVKVSTTTSTTAATTSKNAPQTKPETPRVFDKQGNVKQLPDKKNAAKNQTSTPTRGDGFTRPRVVKNPKFE
jgi:serine/threonine protein kinase